mgnify:CR=1 FL=1
MQAVALTKFQRLARAYRIAALIGFNTLLLFLLLNLPFYLADFLYPDEDEPAKLGRRVLGTYGLEHLKKGYPGMTAEEVAQLQHETWSRLVVYEPFTEFKEPAFQGRFIKVSPHGFREVAEQGPWPPDPRNFNVFVLGGSTTFGYGVADGQTIPSHLQRHLRSLLPGRPVCVYNFGRCAYYSTQERILFQQLLEAGLRPDLAVFVDGLNDSGHTKDGSGFSNTLGAAVEQYEPQRARRGLAAQAFPAVRHARRLLLRAGWLKEGGGQAVADAETTPLWAGEEDQIVRRMVDRYLANLEMVAAIADRFKVKTLFVWQPVPNFRAPPDTSRFPKDKVPVRRSPAVYEQLDRMRATGKLPGNFLWLADLQLGRTGDLYIDTYHYTPQFSEVLAVETARHLAASGGLR